MDIFQLCLFSEPRWFPRECLKLLSPFWICLLLARLHRESSPPRLTFSACYGALLVAILWDFKVRFTSTKLLSCRKFMVKGHAKISSSSKVTGCAENSSFSNSDIQTENGRSQCFTPQKCPMKIQCRVHSVYSWTFHWEHVTAITYYAYKFQIFSNIPKYFQLLGCLDLLFELQRTLQGHSSPATASYHQAAKASLSLGVDKPPQ